MLFDQYKTALLCAVEDYQTKRGKALSQQRKKDIDDLIKIIKNADYPNAFMLKRELEIRLYKMKTGFWIFQTGHSDLKSALQTILRAPQNQPEMICKRSIKHSYFQEVIFVILLFFLPEKSNENNRNSNPNTSD